MGGAGVGQSGRASRTRSAIGLTEQQAGRGISRASLTFTHVISCVRVATFYLLPASSTSYTFILIRSTGPDLTQCTTLSVQNNLLQEELVLTVSLRPERSQYKNLLSKQVYMKCTRHWRFFPLMSSCILITIIIIIMSLFTS